MTQFTTGDLLQHEREKVARPKRVSQPALRLLHINTFVLELCQRYCEGKKMTQVCSSHQRGMPVTGCTEAALLRMQDI